MDRVISPAGFPADNLAKSTLIANFGQEEN